MKTLVWTLLAATALLDPARAQSIHSGTVSGTITDQSNLVVAGATVELRNASSGYNQTRATDASGQFRFNAVPLANYRLTASLTGFATAAQIVEVRSSVPLELALTLKVQETSSTVNVEARGDLVETDPTAHVDIDLNQMSKLPTSSPGAGLSDVITLTSGGVVAESNGGFHPLGDHGQVTMVIDGQPNSDQQSKVFSTSLPTSAIQGMELTTGSPDAEFGDKTSMVAQITTRTGLGAGRVFGSVESSYGSFGTPGISAGLGFGNSKFGNFLAMDGVRSGRFLDTPEFQPIHDAGNNESLFDRLDWVPASKDVIHLNIFLARNWLQIPNSFDQLSQDQRQRVLTWSLAPAYQHSFNSKMLLTVNPYVRKDQFNYYASDNPLADTPATQSQTRQLMNWGVKPDLSIVSGRHNIKFGLDLKQTRLLENFGFGITDPAFNSPCVDMAGLPAGVASLTNPSQCAGAGFLPNTGTFSPSLLPYDLSRNGALFHFHSTGNINQQALYFQDAITFGNLMVSAGFRFDHYAGLTTSSQPEPRLGLAYHVKPTGTVLRVAYSRSLETPFNENLLLSSATGVGGLAQNVFGANSVQIEPGFRNQFNTGLQQSIRKFLLIDVDYFWKYTHNAFDFSTLLNTTITFPIAWHNSKIDGVTGRLSTTNLHGFQAYWTFGHTRARFFFPETGGLIPQGTPLNGSVFRIDHDQAFQSTVNLRYQRPKNAEWIAFTWRLDSGAVVSGVPDAAAALDLTANQQTTIGLACNGVLATPTSPLTSCDGVVTSKLLTLPQTGMENDDHNPDRVRPRSIFNIGFGSDNLLHREGTRRFKASIEISNLDNKVALYNFLSTFSGTHFVEPRSITARFGYTF